MKFQSKFFLVKALKYTNLPTRRRRRKRDERATGNHLQQIQDPAKWQSTTSKSIATIKQNLYLRRQFYIPLLLGRANHHNYIRVKREENRVKTKEQITIHAQFQFVPLSHAKRTKDLWVFPE